MIEVAGKPINFSQPELFILNEIDRPCEKLIVQRIGPNHFKYIHPDFSNWNVMQKDFNTTPLITFGVAHQVEDDLIHFKVVANSAAKYRNGNPRQWQGADEFTLPYTKPLVTLVE